MENIKLNDPSQIQTISDLGLDLLFWQTCALEEEVAAQKSAIKEEFMHRLADKKRDSIEVGESIVTRYPKVYTNGVNIETARKYGAIKVEEKVNGAVITKLYKSGVKVEGVEERWEIRISKAKRKEEGA